MNVARQSVSWKPGTGPVLVADIFISEGRFRRGPTMYTPCYSRDCTSRAPLLAPAVMLPRRNSTIPTPSHVPSTSRPASGSIGGGQPLNLVTTQQVFRASTALTVETESPVSETSPQELPPIPLHLPLGNNEPKRQPTQHNETFHSILEEHVPPQPPSVPTPILPQTSEPTPSHSDSDPPRCGFADMSGGVHAKVWPTYNKISREFDATRLAKWNTDLDALLVFVSLMVGTDH